MITQLKRFVHNLKFNGNIRALYQSLYENKVSAYVRILKQLEIHPSLSDILPNLLVSVCEYGKSKDYLIPVLELGIHPDTPNGSGQLPLHLAVENGNEEYVRILLEFGADPNITDSNGVTPLHISYSYDSLGGISDLLVAKGADLNLRDKLGKRYLM